MQVESKTVLKNWLKSIGNDSALGKRVRNPQIQLKRNLPCRNGQKPKAQQKERKVLKVIMWLNQSCSKQHVNAVIARKLSLRITVTKKRRRKATKSHLLENRANLLVHLLDRIPLMMMGTVGKEIAEKDLVVVVAAVMEKLVRMLIVNPCYTWRETERLQSLNLMD